MDSQADILAILAVVLLGGKLAGHLGQRLGLPTAVGKIAVGLLLGPAVLGVVSLQGTLADLSDIGVILLMFLAGLETDTDTMRRVTVPAFAVALGGVAIPFGGGLGLGYAFHLSQAETLFLGAILTATSVSISAQTLRELGRLQSKEGTTILAAAVIDDILGIVILAFVFAIAGGEDPLPALAKMALFLPIAFVLGHIALGPLVRRLGSHLSEEAHLTLVIAVALAYAWAAQHLGGVAAVTGAYMAGLLVARIDLAERVNHGLNWLVYGFFIPLFFVGIGLQADFRSLGEAPVLVLALLAVAVAGKVAGCFAGARLTGFATEEALRVGVGMMSRGEIALVVAAAGLSAGAIDGTVFSASVLMALVTTILTPILLKLTYLPKPRPEPSPWLVVEEVGAFW
jgi:Kef-type K+ transport system membrane component KefB